MVRTKVFVGNLSFKTTEAQLAQEFKAAGTVVSANIITRGPRSLGYGFVELENEEDAKNSVKVMNKKEIDGRQINVEVAKPREEEPQTEEGQQGNVQNFRGRGRGGFRGGFRGSSFRGRGRGFSPKQSFRPRNQEEGSQTTDRPERTERTDRPERSERPDRSERTDRPDRQDRERAPRAPNPRGSSSPRGRGPRVPRTPIEERANSAPSKTSLFVANLPFSLDDEGFGKVFTDAGLKFKSAYVVRKRNGHSKGFGFAEFETEEDQQKALALNGKKIGNPERELIMKIALTEAKEEKGSEVPKKEEKAEEKKEEKKRREERRKKERREKVKLSKNKF